MRTFKCQLDDLLVCMCDHLSKVSPHLPQLPDGWEEGEEELW
jgi:hypothetical protein